MRHGGIALSLALGEALEDVQLRCAKLVAAGGLSQDPAAAAPGSLEAAFTGRAGPESYLHTDDPEALERGQV
jgi:hypothetical protein